MTDTNTAPVLITEEQRQILWTTFHDQYTSLMNLINGLPVHDALRLLVNQDLHRTFCVIKESFASLVVTPACAETVPGIESPLKEI